ncbi:hypothetical protein [Cytobacillus firmus]
MYRKVEGMKSPQKPKAARLIVTEDHKMARFEIGTLVPRYHS